MLSVKIISLILRRKLFLQTGSHKIKAALALLVHLLISSFALSVIATLLSSYREEGRRPAQLYGYLLVFLLLSVFQHLSLVHITLFLPGSFFNFASYHHTSVTGRHCLQCLSRQFVPACPVGLSFLLFTTSFITL